jgi:hypothetical protein
VVRFQCESVVALAQAERRHGQKEKEHMAGRLRPVADRTWKGVFGSEYLLSNRPRLPHG